VGILLLVTTSVFGAGPDAWEVSCDNGVDIGRVQALGKRTVEALKSNQAKVVQEDQPP
jgi:hypothetical protein